MSENSLMLFASRSGVYITFSWIWVDICLMKRIWQKLCSWRKAKLEKAMPFLPVSLRTCSGSFQSPCESSYPRTAVSGDDVEMKESVREGGRERKRERQRTWAVSYSCVPSPGADMQDKEASRWCQFQSLFDCDLKSCPEQETPS